MTDFTPCIFWLGVIFLVCFLYCFLMKKGPERLRTKILKIDVVTIRELNHCVRWKKQFENIFHSHIADELQHSRLIQNWCNHCWLRAAKCRSFLDDYGPPPRKGLYRDKPAMTRKVILLSYPKDCSLYTLHH